MKIRGAWYIVSRACKGKKAKIRQRGCKKIMWRLVGEGDKIGRRKIGVIERNDFDNSGYWEKDKFELVAGEIINGTYKLCKGP